jgi:large-conductance mechanosensitive channel
MILIRFALITLIIYLIVRSFAKFSGSSTHVTGRPESKEGNTKDNKKISKEIGEYIDYEDIGK